MIVDIDKRPETESGWFELRDGGRVHLRLMSADDLREIRKTCITSETEYPLLGGKYQRFEVQKFDDEAFDVLMWDKTIIGWEQILDRNAHPVPVSKEMKALLMRNVPEFYEAVNNGLKSLKESEAARVEAARGN